jgi:metal-responsive CopG/Arc/MetJ family transcriptional regulator
MARTAEQVSVSLPTHLVEWLDRKAKENGASRSNVLAQELEIRRRQEWEELFAEGCREFTEEMSATAAETFAAQAEVALREPFDAD